MVSMPNQGRIREGLLREDLFTVVHDLFVTDTALYADYVLPATSQIEHLDLSPAWGHLYLALNRPAIAPRGESVSNTELFRRLARALGRTEAWLFESDESMLRGGAGERAPMARGDHLRTAVGRGLRASELSGGLAAVRERRLRDADRARRSSIRSRSTSVGHDPLPSAGEIRSGARAAAHHRQDRCTSSTPATATWSATAGARESCSSRSTPTMRGRGRGQWRRGARLERARRSARRVLGLGSRAPGRRLDAVRRPGGCQWRAALGERPHARRSRPTGAAAAASTTRSSKWRRSPLICRPLPLSMSSSRP